MYIKSLILLTKLPLEFTPINIFLIIIYILQFFILPKLIVYFGLIEYITDYYREI